MMSRPVEFMLARWFLLYPEGMQEYREGMGHEEDEGSRAGEIARVKSGVNSAHSGIRGTWPVSLWR